MHQQVKCYQVIYLRRFENIYDDKNQDKNAERQTLHRHKKSFRFDSFCLIQI